MFRNSILLTLIVAHPAFIVSSEIPAMVTPPKVMVHNQYGATVALKINGDNHEIRVNNNQQVVLYPIDKVHSLSIRTTGIGSGLGASPHTSLEEHLQIIKYAHQNNGIKANPSLIIAPSSILSAWKVKIDGIDYTNAQQEMIKQLIKQK